MIVFITHFMQTGKENMKRENTRRPCEEILRIKWTFQKLLAAMHSTHDTMLPDKMQKNEAIAHLKQYYVLYPSQRPSLH